MTEPKPNNPNRSQPPRTVKTGSTPPRDLSPFGGYGFPFLTALGSVLLRSLMMSCRVDCLRPDLRAALILRKEISFVGALWHEQIVFAAWIFRHRRFVSMISQSHDGELATQLVHRFGYQTVRGSSSRGGPKALSEFVEALRHNASGTPVDGPRGPRRKSKIGMILAAQQAGVPLVPISIGASRYCRLKSWDRMVCPLPGARVLWTLGNPIDVPEQLSSDELRMICCNLDDQLNAQDRHVYSRLHPRKPYDIESSFVW